jgi:hypothetical protein
MPAVNTTFDVKQRLAFYTNQAMAYDEYARRAHKEEDRQKFKKKADEWWDLVAELRGKRGA